MMIAVVTPVAAIAIIVQSRLLDSAAPAPTTSNLETDTATPIAAGTQPANDTAPKDKAPNPLSLPTIEELTPRHTSTPDAQEVAVSMPPNLSEPNNHAITSNNNLPADGSAPDVPSNTRSLLRREGTLARDLVGTVSKQGLHWVFIPDDKSAPLNLLQNQLLERIESILESAEKSPNNPPPSWRLSGRVTEYRSSNYLLITTASQIDSPPAP